VKEIGNWMEIDVSTLADKEDHDQECKDDNRRVNCDNGPYICQYATWNYSEGRTRRWKCGVPKRGMNFPGLDSDKPTNARGYAPGWCGVHVVQYQKPDPSKDLYKLEAKVFDANQNEIGNSAGKHDRVITFGSKLPASFTIRTRAVDNDPVDFEYSNAKWDSNNKDTHHCSVGKYDNGKREIDCGFSC
jgi:hypothetical protein